jgi:hypothetical protein
MTASALIEEHIPDDLRPALVAWAEGHHAARLRAAEDAGETRAAQERHRLADALEVLPLDPDAIADAVLADTRPKIGRTAAELLAEVPEEPAWVIPGLLARSWTIKVAAREKTGKGTFIALLLGAVERGEETLFGPATEPTTALIYTEEPQDSIREKIADAGLRRATVVYGWELGGLDWPGKVDALIDRATDDGHGVIFVDNVSRAAGVEDEAGTELARAVEYLSERAKAAGLAVIIDHHHRKAAGKTEDKSRGGTALAGACDNNVEMERVGTDWTSRVRRLSSRGRVRATHWTRTVALTEDGTGYEVVADTDAPQDGRLRKRLRALRDAGDAGTDAAAFAEAIELGKEAARQTLKELEGEGWAQSTEGKPRRYSITAKGLNALRAEGLAAEEEAEGALPL